MTSGPEQTSNRPAHENFGDDTPHESPSTPPPESTLRWVEQQLGQRVARVTRLDGGMSSAVHRLTLDAADAVVLRRFTLASWLAEEPHIPADEAHNLELLSSLDLGVATPTLVVADLDATHTDVPAIVMTEVPGRPDIDPPDPIMWCERLAACLAHLHEQPVIDRLSRYQRWDNPDRALPAWSTDADLWQHAQSLVRGELPRHPDSFLHRDFHPNNVHWDEHSEICGVVDWLAACTGPAAADISHCRWNLAILVAPEIADHFTDHYRQLTGYSESVLEYDLATVLSGPVGPFPTFAWNALGRHDLTSDSVAIKINAWMRHLIG